MVSSIALRFGTGNAPGNARQTGQVWLFGPPPKPFVQRQNIFVRVFSWTWTSRPITGSHAAAVIGRLRRAYAGRASPERDRTQSPPREPRRRGTGRSRRTAGRSAAA